MQLHRLLFVNILIWGIPSIPTYLIYQISYPFVKTSDELFSQTFGLFVVFVITLVANYEIFWENYYHKYLTEEPRPEVSIKEEKDKKFL